MANKELKSITFEGLDDTYTLLTEEEVNTKLSEYAKTSEITQIDIQTVNALPEVGVKGIIYLVPSTSKMTPLLGNRLATVQANTNNSATFSVDKTTNIKAGMTLKLVHSGTMGDVVVKSIDAKTKTITLTKPATLAKGTLIFDGSKYGKDTHEEYIWNPSTNKFERLGIVDVNAVSTAIPQSVVARDWNGRAQIENPSAAKDIANKNYVDNTVNNKLSEYAKTSELDKKQDTLVSGTNIKTINGESVLGSGNISITTPIDATLSDTSTNAVQNKAVKAAIDGKLNKTTGKQVVYTSDSAGSPSSLPYTTDATKNTIVLRQNNGAIKTGAPVANNDAATKEYVDSKKVTVIDNLTSTSTTAALSANQGKMLKLAIDDKLSSTIVNNDKETDILAGDISVTQINGSSGISGGIKIENAMPTFYSGSKNETIENVIDSVQKVEDLSVIKNDYDIISSSTWTYEGSNSGSNGEPDGRKCHYISYGHPINPQAIESAKIINPSTGAIVATCTGHAQLMGTQDTVYHFGDNYNIIIIEPQDVDIFNLDAGGIIFSDLRKNNLYEGVFLTGPLTYYEAPPSWVPGAINTGGLQSVKVDFGDTPLYIRRSSIKTQHTAVNPQTAYKYITHTDTGTKECELYACVYNITFNSPWGSLYEGTLGRYSFKSGFFTSVPEIHLEMLNTVTGDESGGVACFIETGIKPTTTSTGTLYAVRPNSGATAKEIYFKIHAKQV